jgi:glutathione S-transferase
MKFVELETARQARGLRLAVAAFVPSPWSEAAKSIFHVKGIDFVAVRCDTKRLREEEVRAWTGTHNVPVALFEDEPPRSHWGDILALAERLDQTQPLLPADREPRLRVLGLGHEICGEGGLIWSARLMHIHLSLQAKGERGFPLKVAEYLAGKYGYAPERVPAARQRLAEILGALAADLEGGGPYLVGDRFSALDIYAATALGPLLPLPDDLCPMLPQVRRIFEPMAEQMRELIPTALLTHREFVYRRHLSLPVEL